MVWVATDAVRHAWEGGLGLGWQGLGWVIELGGGSAELTRSTLQHVYGY